MDRPLTKEELRTAARQAMTLAHSLPDSLAREGLIARAERLFKEADGTADNA